MIYCAPQEDDRYTSIFTFIHLADAFIQRDLQLRNARSGSSLRGK